MNMKGLTKQASVQWRLAVTVRRDAGAERQQSKPWVVGQ